MKYTFELCANIIKDFTVEADSVDEAYTIIAENFEKHPVIPVSITSLESVEIAPVAADAFDSEEEEDGFWSTPWEDAFYFAVDHIEEQQ